MTLADRILSFIRQLDYPDTNLPSGIHLINPYREQGQALEIANTFYHRFYNDNKPRFIILGINPGRFGAGVTGIPFTDSKRLMSECGIEYSGKSTHEPSSVFIYEMIRAFGGVKAFYEKFYINSVCPLGLTVTDENGREKNYNYYDSKIVMNVLNDFIIENIEKQIALGVRRDKCFCFGTGKNENILNKINDKHHFFEEIVALEHPRFIVQYKSSKKQYYIDKYVAAFNEDCRPLF